MGVVERRRIYGGFLARQTLFVAGTSPKICSGSRVGCTYSHMAKWRLLQQKL
jgi:hypothetical protein